MKVFGLRIANAIPIDSLIFYENSFSHEIENFALIYIKAIYIVLWLGGII